MMNFLRAVLLSLLSTVALFYASVAGLGFFGFLFLYAAPLLLGFTAAAFLAIGRRETLLICAAAAGVAAAIVLAAWFRTGLPGAIWILPAAEAGALAGFRMFHRPAVTTAARSARAASP